MTSVSGAARRVRAAKFPEDLFGDDPDNVTSAYRELARYLHPDVHGGASKFTAIFTRLNELKEQAVEAMAAGTYGKRVPPVKPPPPPVPVVLTLKKATYTLLPDPVAGDVADVYRGRREAGKAAPVQCAVKVARSAAEKDLMLAEAEALKKLVPKGKESEGLHKLFPSLLDSFEVAEKGVRRRVNVMPWAEGYYSLIDVAKAYPDRLDFRDAAWMIKRLLSALAAAHALGIVHGAVLPSHILIHPESHGIKLVDWCYSVPIGQPLKAYSVPSRGQYPPEVWPKNPATPGLDVYMASRIALWLCNDQTPAPFEMFFKGCMLAAPSRRPQDCFQLYDELDKLLAELVGPRKFRPFEMPEVAAP